MSSLVVVVPFFIFLANVLMGAFGYPAFMDDIAEMSALCLSSVGFVVLILVHEKKAAKNKRDVT